MACNIAANRLRKELSKLRKDPPPGILAEPKEADILTWFYALRGPPDTPYEGGIYIGKLKFPAEYPMKPPSILMLTPSGRFVVNTRICMSMSDFHPESWNPMWSVSTILQGVVSFMASEEQTTGGNIQASSQERKQFAAASKAYNQKHYSHLFDGDIEGALRGDTNAAEQAAADLDGATEKENSTTTPSSASNKGRGRRIAGPRRKARPAKTPTEEMKGDAAPAVTEDDDHDEAEDDDNNSNNETEDTNNNNDNDTAAAELARKKKNAKKRAKQKAKKAAAALANATATDTTTNNNEKG